MNDQSANPFQAPTAYESANDQHPHWDKSPPVARPPVNPLFVFLKWIAICFVSAGPSFFIAFSLGKHVILQCVAMVLGILLFVLAYTYVECRPSTQTALANRRLRITAWIGYGSRIFASIVFPIGMALDMITGMLSTGFSSALFGGWMPTRNLEDDHSEQATFLWYFVTTIIQGIFMNILLLLYMLFVFGMVVLISLFRQWLSSERVKDEPLSTDL